MKKDSVLKKIFGNSKEQKKSSCCNVMIEKVKEETKSKPSKDSCCNVVIEEIEE